MVKWATIGYNQAVMIDLKKYQKNLSHVSTHKVKGRITELIGLVARAVVPGVKVGELCIIEPMGGAAPVKAEVVGFKDSEVLLMPLGNLEGIAPGSEVTPTGDCLKVPVGYELLGRILDGLGDPLDTDTKGPLLCSDYYPVHNDPPDPLKRRRVTQPITLGIKAIDAVIT